MGLSPYNTAIFLLALPLTHRFIILFLD